MKLSLGTYIIQYLVDFLTYPSRKRRERREEAANMDEHERLVAHSNRVEKFCFIFPWVLLALTVAVIFLIASPWALLLLIPTVILMIFIWRFTWWYDRKLGLID